MTVPRKTLYKKSGHAFFEIEADVFSTRGLIGGFQGGKESCTTSSSATSSGSLVPRLGIAGGIEVFGEAEGEVESGMSSWLMAAGGLSILGTFEIPSCWDEYDSASSLATARDALL